MTFNLTFTENQVYAGILMLLVILQVYQQYQIRKANKQMKQLWDQFAFFLYTVGTKLAEMEGKQQIKQEQNETKN